MWSTMARQDSHISISSTSTGARGSSPMMGESAEKVRRNALGSQLERERTKGAGS